MTTLLVSGPRDWGRTMAEEVALWTALEKFSEHYGLHEIVHGAAPGADSIAREFARTRPEITESAFPADWARYNKSAGPRRNKAMVEHVIGQAIEHGAANVFAMVCHRDDAWTPGTSNLYGRLRNEARVVPILVTHVTLGGTTEEALSA